MESPATTEGSGGDATPRKDTRREHGELGTGASGRRVSFEVELGPCGCFGVCLVLCWRLSFLVAGKRKSEIDSVLRPAAVPSEHAELAGHPLVQQSTRAKDQRLCYTDLDQTVRVLIGSVSCGEVLFARRCSDVASCVGHFAHKDAKKI